MCGGQQGPDVQRDTSPTSPRVAPAKQKKQDNYRIAKIEIKSGDAVDQIKFVHDDGTSCAHGHNGGKADARPCILSAGEYLVRVTHERFLNYLCAGAAVEFETNKGRVFSYQPQGMATRRQSELTTFNVNEGNEIIGLTIRRGILLGIDQQPVPVAERGSFPKEWYAVVSGKKKSDTSVRHFHTKAAAMQNWTEAQAFARSGAGRASILINCMTLEVQKRAGETVRVKECIEEATQLGLCAAKMEGQTSMLEAITMLFRLLGDKRDVRMFSVVVFLLSLSMWLELEAQLLTGHVLALVTSQSNESIGDSMFINATCAHAVDCTEPTFGLKKAVIAAFVSVKMMEKLFYVANVWFHHNACDIKNHQLRINAFNHVLSLDQPFFDTHSKSEIMGSMNVHSINNLITWNIPYLFGLSLQVVMIIYFMLMINVELGSLCLVGSLFIQYGILEPLNAIERNVHRIQRKLDTNNRQIVDEAFSMSSSIKMFSKETHHTSEHETSQRRYMQNINTVVVLRCVREFGYGVSQVVVFGVLLYRGMTAFSRASITPGDLTGFFLLLQKFQTLFGRIKWHYELLVREFPDIERFLTLMAAEPTIRSGSTKQEVKGEIEFKNVRFEYPSRPGEEVLKGMNLRVQANKITAIVGDSGAGKSTIAKLVMRLYDPKQGQIMLDGVDLRDMDLAYLHGQIGIVNQNPDLFNSSLADNIGYGATGNGYSNEQVKEAGKLANCDFISKFRGGFDTFAGDRGADLSGGQKQRLAIARAAIRDPKILILDEATSSLDTKNEQLVQEALERLMHGRTILVIAHRLSTIKSADEIVCMRDGEVVERGTHDDLLKTGTIYRDLVERQLVQ